MGCTNSTNASKPQESLPTYLELQNEGVMAAILTKHGNKGVVGACEFENLSFKGGASGELWKCSLNMEDGSKTSVVFKCTKGTDDKDVTVQMSKNFKLYRESLYYTNFHARASKAGVGLPKIWLSTYDPETGRQLIVMEDLCHTVTVDDIFPQDDPTKQKDMSELNAKAGIELSILSCSKMCLAMLADMHAEFWMDKSLIKDHSHWLRGANWRKGDKADFGEWLKLQSGMNQGTLNKADDATGKLELSDLVRDCIKHSEEHTTYESTKAIWDQPGAVWTLTHGDFHSKQLMYDPTQKKIIMVDYELCGIGNPMADVATYLIMRFEPEQRKEMEGELVKCYYDALMKTGKVTGYTWEKCWEDYLFFGANKFMFYVPLMGAYAPCVTVNYIGGHWGAFLADQNFDATKIASCLSQ